MHGATITMGFCLQARLPGNWAVRDELSSRAGPTACDRPMSTIAVPQIHVPCDKCPLRSRTALRDFSPVELEFIRSFKSGELTATAGTSLLLQGTNGTHLYTVLSGWAFRYKTLADGRRQILNFALPADFLGLQKRLSATKAMRWKYRTFEILDRDALVRIAGYETTEQRRRPFI